MNISDHHKDKIDPLRHGRDVKPSRQPRASGIFQIFPLELYTGLTVQNAQLVIPIVEDANWTDAFSQLFFCIAVFSSATATPLS